MVVWRRKFRFIGVSITQIALMQLPMLRCHRRNA